MAPLLFMAPQLQAAPSTGQLLQLSQPDGATFLARRVGDEWCNRIETSTGHSIQQDGSGYWRYVAGITGSRLSLSDRRADQPPVSQLQLQPHLHAPCTVPESIAQRGTRQQDPSIFADFTGHVVFLLASFSDAPGTWSEEDFAAFLEQDVGDFYRTSSHGAVDLLPADEQYGVPANGVVGWLDLGYRHPNPGGSIDRRNQMITRDAILASDPYIDYASYDANSDGYVDADELAVVVITAGFEAATGAYGPSVWGHQWDLGLLGAPKVDGVRVGDGHMDSGGYCQFGETHRSTEDDAHQATMGIMVHELGHLIFRLPDLYDTDYSSNGAGIFCHMSFGTWGASLDDAYSGETPVMPCAYVRQTMGWVTPMSGSGTASLVATGASVADGTNTVHQARTQDTSQYFLLENRSPVGYDRGLEVWLGASFSGIALWHIDTSVGGNSNDARRLVDLEESDGSATASEATNLWYQGNPMGGTVFDNTSVPSSKLNNGRPSGVTVTGFSIPGKTMQAEVTTKTR